jgi:hypothetical protein
MYWFAIFVIYFLIFRFTFGIYSPLYLFKIYRNGLMISKRIEGWQKYHPPPDTENFQSDRYESRYNPRFFITDMKFRSKFFNNNSILELYYLRAAANQPERFRHFVIVTSDEKWIMFPMPFFGNFDEILSAFQLAFGKRWEHICTGLH